MSIIKTFKYKSFTTLLHTHKVRSISSRDFLFEFKQDELLNFHIKNNIYSSVKQINRFEYKHIHKIVWHYQHEKHYFEI